MQYASSVHTYIHILIVLKYSRIQFYRSFHHRSIFPCSPPPCHHISSPKSRVPRPQSHPQLFRPRSPQTLQLIFHFHSHIPLRHYVLGLCASYEYEDAEATTELSMYIRPYSFTDPDLKDGKEVRDGRLDEKKKFESKFKSVMLMMIIREIS